MQTARLLTTVVMLLAASNLIAEDKEVMELIGQLDKGSLVEKTKAARLLGEIGPGAAAAIPALVKSLEVDNQGLRYEVVVSLGQINSDPVRVVPALNSLLSDPLPHLRQSVIDSLRRFHADAKSSLPQLKQLLNDKEPMIAVSAARAISEIQVGDLAAIQLAIPVLIAGLKNERNDVSSEAIQGLALIGAPVVSAIEELLDGANPVARLNACDTLAAIGPGAVRAVDRLAKAAIASDAKLRWHAIIALGEIGAAEKSTIPTLIAALADPDLQVKISAEQSLQKIGKVAVPALIDGLKSDKHQRFILTIISELGPDAAQSVPALASMLSSKDAELQREVILALAGIGPDAKSTTVQLIKMLDDQQFSFRPAVAYALGRIGAKEAVSSLKKALESPDDQTLRIASIWSLLQIDPTNDKYVTTAIPLLTKAMESEKPVVRLEAARALGRIGARAKNAITALQIALSDKSPLVRREALIALAEIGPDSSVAITDIIKILTDGDTEFRPIACYALGKIGTASKPAIPQLHRMLNGRDPHERTVAAWALVQIAPDRETIETAIPLLCTALNFSENPRVRLESAITLGKIGSGSNEAKQSLQSALKDSDESVRKSAEAAIAHLK